MKKSYLFLAEGFEEVEAVTVIDVLRRAGLPLVTVSISDCQTVCGAHGIAVEADVLFSETTFDDAEWLILPGGMPGTTHLGECEPLCDLLKSHARLGKPMAAICAAPSVFGQLGLLSGRRATCYPGFEPMLAGAEVAAERVVTDGNIVTGNGPASALPFALAIAASAVSETVAQEVAAGMLV